MKNYRFGIHIPGLFVILFTLVLSALVLIPSASAAQTACEDPYTVRRGDTLFRIAQVCDTTVEALLDANPDIEDAALIFPGQEIDIPDEVLPPTGAETYTVRRGDTLREIAEMFDTTVNAILDANPDIDDPDLIFPGQVLELPEGAVLPPTGDEDTYTVRRGDTLSEIAARFDTTVAALLRANPEIDDPALIFPGQVLVIPDGAALPPTGDLETYTVRRGDTLREIADMFDTTVSAILDANPDIDDPDLIFPGQEIQIPDGAVVPPTGADTYVVQRGDTLFRIARRFDTTVDILLDLNPKIDDEDLIFAGMVLRIP